MTKTEAKWVLSGDPKARAAAQRVLEARRRVAAKKAPGRASARDAKAERKARTAAVREAVFARDGGRCICGAEATDLHHCLSGPDRMAKEHERTCIAVCRYCHRRLHDGALVEMMGARERCAAFGMVNASAAIDRRIAKIAAMVDP